MVSAYYANLGLTSYSETLTLRKQLVDMRHSGTLGRDVVLFTEHQPTILLGRNAKIDEETLKQHGLQVCEIPNKGSYYAGPGQAFFYIINDYTRLLKPHDVTNHNKLIDTTIAHSLEKLGINVTPMNDGKPLTITDKTLSMTHKVASHGFRIHVSKSALKHNNLVGSQFISLEDVLGYEPLAEHVSEAVLGSIKKNFKYDRLDECAISKFKDSISIKTI